MADNGQLISTLNNLIETCTDAEKGFHTAAECVKNHALKTLFQSYSGERGRFASELQTEVRRLGGSPEQSGTVAGALWRGWTNLKAVVTGGNESAIITECERGEDAARHNYDEALKDGLPPEVLTIVQRQFTAVKEAHDRIRALEVAASKL